MLKTVLAGIGLTSVTLAAGVAIHAHYYNGSDRPEALPVNYRAFDLTTPQGVALLERRIDAAVDRICGGSGEAYARYADEDECRRDAWASARPQMERAVDEAYRARDRQSWGDERRGWGEPARYDEPPRYDADRRGGWLPDGPPPGYAPRGPRGGWQSDGPPPGDYSPPPAMRPAWGAPAMGPRGGVLGGPLDDRIGEAFETGDNVAWRDHGWRGLVQVSEPRRYGRSLCRTVAVVRRAGQGWAPVRDGVVCLKPDGALHNRPFL